MTDPERHRLRLAEVIVYVSDMARAVRFYRDVLRMNLAFPQKDDYASEYWVAFDGDCKLCLHGGGIQHEDHEGPKLVFYVDSVEMERERLARANVKVGSVRSPAPGVKVVDFWDPDGTRLSIEETVAGDR